MKNKSRIHKILAYLLRRRYLSYWAVLAIDTVIAAASFVGAYILIGGLVRSVEIVPREILYLANISVPSSIFAYFCLGTYRQIIRHLTITELWRITACVLVNASIMFVVIFYAMSWRYFTDNMLILYLILSSAFMFILMVGVRLFMVVVYEKFFVKYNSSRQKPTIIYGICEKSVALRMRLTASSHYKVIGFCMTGPGHRVTYRVAGLPVYRIGNENDLRKIIRQNGVNTILFPDRLSLRKEKTNLLPYCKSNRLNILIAPEIGDYDTNNGSIPGGIRAVNIEDILGREEIATDMEKVLADIRGKTVLVTGAAGSIGSELCRQIARLDVGRLVLFDSAETPMHNMQLELRAKFPELDFITIIGDVRIKAGIESVFRTYNPEIVLHAAAYKHVPLMEMNPCEAALVNVTGTRNIADIAVKYGAEKMIMVSTDKAVNPTNVMGASKRMAEIYVQSLGYAISEGEVPGKTHFITTRFGNVLGSNGSVIPLFKSQIENGGPLTVTHPDITRFFMTIPEACQLVLQATAIGNGNEIFVFDMGDPVKIANLARQMIMLSGKDIEIKFTGLRPGEKLYEEVLNADENLIPTSDKRIKIARVRRYQYRSIVETYVELERLSQNLDAIETVKLMKRFIPEFISRNSKYSAMDAEPVPASSSPTDIHDINS